MRSANVEHVSDTALWVAHYRAEESKRPDAAFTDALAQKLVGERGRAIARRMGFSGPMHQVMLVRTVAIDRFVRQAVQAGADMVINLGAGLDTRPYRMKDLPAGLRWVEVDFPWMLAYKAEHLAGDTPVCRLERIAADLSQDAERQAVLQRLGGETKRAVVITEGVIPYLTSQQAEVLSRDLRAVPAFQHWVMDFQNGGLLRGPVRAVSARLKKAPFRFGAAHYFEFFGQQGWQVEAQAGMYDESERIGRPIWRMQPPFSWLFRLMPPRGVAEWNYRYGVVMFKRA